MEQLFKVIRKWWWGLSFTTKKWIIGIPVLVIFLLVVINGFAADISRQLNYPHPENIRKLLWLVAGIPCGIFVIKKVLSRLTLW